MLRDNKEMTQAEYANAVPSGYNAKLGRGTGDVLFHRLVKYSSGFAHPDDRPKVYGSGRQITHASPSQNTHTHNSSCIGCGSGFYCTASGDGNCANCVRR